MIHMISRVSEHTNVTFLSNVLIKSIVMTVKTGSSFNILSPLYCKLVSISPVYSDVVSQLTSCESRLRKDTDALGHPDLLLSVDECAVDLSLVTVLETKKESYKHMILPSTPLRDMVSETFNGNYGFTYFFCVNFSLEFESLVSRRLLHFF